MLYAYTNRYARLTRLASDADLVDAVWIDLIQPTDQEVEALKAMGVHIPTLADMEEIELSNRLYREDGYEFMTAMLPGERGDSTRAAMPVCFILSQDRLVTVRHHSPRPFLTYPNRGERSSLGCGSPAAIFLGLLEEIIARQADILEGTGRVLDETMSSIFCTTRPVNNIAPDKLNAALHTVGRESELMALVQLALMTLERVLAFYTAIADNEGESKKLKSTGRAQIRDIQSLELHAEFLSSRISLTVDTTLGLINLQQTNTSRILSVIAALFLPPTLIASIYGMNFAHMPILNASWGYPMALGLMVLTSLIVWIFLRKKGYL